MIEHFPTNKVKQFDGKGEWVQTKKRFKAEEEGKGTGARLGDNPQCKYRWHLDSLLVF